MTDEEFEKHKQALEAAGYTVTGRRIHDLDLLLLIGASTHSHFYPVFDQGIRGHTIFDFKMLDALIREEVTEVVPLTPKNKPWYQKYDKYVGRRRQK